MTFKDSKLNPILIFSIKSDISIVILQFLLYSSLDSSYIQTCNQNWINNYEWYPI